MKPRDDPRGFCFIGSGYIQAHKTLLRNNWNRLRLPVYSLAGE